MTAQRTLSRALGLVLATTLLLAGCTAPQEPLGAKVVEKGGAPPGPAPAPDAGPGPGGEDPGSPVGGGSVLNAAPRVLAFTGSLERADNGGGSVEVFRARVADDNAEQDIASLVLSARGPQRLVQSLDLGPADLARRAEATPGPGAWVVWDAVPHDGVLELAVSFAYPYALAPGTYTWTLSVEDRAGLRAASESLARTVDAMKVVEVEGAVAADGSEAGAEGWGQWSAAPGAQHVPGVTFLKVRNRGTSPDQAFLVDFTARHFQGREDPAWRVPLDGNVRFAAWEARAGEPPSEGSFLFGEPSADGSVTLRFTRTGAVMYVAYEVVQVPTPLPAQVYHASATVTAL